MTALQFFHQALELVVADGDAVYAAAEDFSNGLVLDRTENGSREIFEVEVWSGEWAGLFGQSRRS